MSRHEIRVEMWRGARPHRALNATLRSLDVILSVLGAPDGFKQEKETRSDLTF